MPHLLHRAYLCLCLAAFSIKSNIFAYLHELDDRATPDPTLHDSQETIQMVSRNFSDS